MSVEIVPVRSPGDLRRFFELPWRIYAGDSVWVPPLLLDLKKQFDTSKNPFFRHAEVKSFLALAGVDVVGRICAIRNDAHNRFHGDRTGFFGFFEVWDGPGSPQTDGEVTTRALIDAASAWVEERGLDRLQGPVNFSTNDACGVQIDGYQDPPTIMMTYNPPHYDRLLRSAGLEKEKDMVTYRMTADGPYPERFGRLAAVVEKRSGVRLRKMRKDRFRDELEIVKEIYNDAWEKNWGFVPMTGEEIDHVAKEFKPFLSENLVIFAERDGETMGFAWALEDWNQAIRYANGRLLPLGLLKILWNKRKIDRIRVLTLGVKRDFRGMGIDNLLCMGLFNNGVGMGIYKGEFGWILEDNHAMRKMLDKIGAEVSKTYRIYEKAST